MATQIDAFIRLRRGTDSELQTVVLSSGEISYTTDKERLYVGNGTLSGGNVAGNKIFYGTSPSSKAVQYDLFFKTTTSEFFILTGGAGDNLGNYIPIVRAIQSGGGLIVNNDGTIGTDSSYFNGKFVNLSGDVMTGSLSTIGLSAGSYSVFKDLVDHKTNRIVNVGDPVQSGDAVNKVTLDNSLFTLSANLMTIIANLSTNVTNISSNFVKKAGDTMTGKLTIQNTLSVTGNIVSNSDVIGFY
jgi:hypothetical protein